MKNVLHIFYSTLHHLLSYLGLPPGLGLDPDCDGRLIPPDGRLLPELGNCALPEKYNLLLFFPVYRFDNILIKA